MAFLQDQETETKAKSNVIDSDVGAFITFVAHSKFNCAPITYPLL
jgi:hypothetical protein